MSESDFEAKTSPAFPIVGLGASAGGLEAYEDFFSHLPAKPACAFVLIMHLDPDHKSMLPDLLSKATGLQVVQATDGMLVEPGRIHVIPPNTTMFLREGALRLEKPAQGRGMRRPIDDFFRSLAEELGPHSVGIIFSGTGSDGTQGLREIKFAGGVSMIQDPSTAKYESMPLSAKNAGVVDVSLPAAELAERFAELLQKRGDVHVEVDELEERKENEQLNDVLQEVHAQTGRDLSHYKRTTLMRRIEKRMLLKERMTLPEYRSLLERDEDEVRALLKELQIGVTSFFRDAEAFRIVEEQVVPRLFADKPKRESIRIWVPGCATGEEAYSLAMLFAGYMDKNKERRQIQMFGTDIDEEAIARARTGVYPPSAVADVPEEFRERYFRRQNGDYALTSSIREMIVFAPHNLIENPPFFKLDLISCRNLLIYLTPQAQKKIIPLFFYALLPERYLLLGPAETLGSHAHLFRNIDTKWKVYQRKDVPESRVDIPMATKGIWRRGEAEAQTSAKPREDYSYILRDAMAAVYGHPGVLLDDRDEIVQVFGDVHDYLGLADGDPTSDVYRLARAPLRLHLRSAVHKARKEKKQIIYQGIVMEGPDSRAYDLVVAPAPVKGKESDMLLVSFRPSGGGNAVQPIPEAVARDQIIQQLEEELRISNDKLQSTVEDLESANEELKSSNEELMSMNEELQSTNEELETSQEELQALNEELSTVNSELQAKISELDEAKSDLENLLASSDIATIFIDRDLVIRQFTPAASNIFHLVPGDVGRPLDHFASRMPGEDIPHDAREVLQTGKRQDRELRSEQGRWYLARFFPYYDQDERLDGVVLTFVDITDRRKIEYELRSSRERLKLALDATGAGVFDHRVPLDETTYHSEQWAELLGYASEELPAYDTFLDWLNEQIHPDDRESVNKAYEKYVKGDLEKYDIEFRIKHKQGKHIWVRRVSKAVERDEKGRAKRIVGLLMDVTNRKKIEQELIAAKEELEKRVRARTQELAESKSLLQSLVDNFPNGSVLLFDKDLKFLVASGEALDQIGYRPEQLIGERLTEVIEPELAAQLEPAYRRALDGEKVRMEVSDRGEDFDLWIVPVRDEKGKVTAGMVMSQIITESRKMQQELIEAKNMAQAANAAKSAFLANMSHEIRSPLTGVLGIAQLMQINPCCDQVGKSAAMITEAGEQLLAIINDILDISRIEADKVVLQIEPTNVRELVNHVRNLYVKLAEDKGLTLKVKIDDGLPDYIELDATRLNQILNNLVSNAVKYTDKGHVDIHVGSKKTGGKLALVCTVSDTGVGIPKDKQEAIFESFYQAEDFLTKSHQGTGLGLAITQRLLKLMNGQLSVTSEPGKGSAFTFTIPGLAVSEAPDTSTSPSAPVNELKGMCPMKVLVVEDNKVNRLFITEMLKMSECEVLEAENGLKALSMIENENFDVVLMDVQMPEMDGIEATKLIRESKDERVRKTKIIAMTAYAMSEDRKKLLKAGMDGYISKPVDLDALAKTIKSLFN